MDFKSRISSPFHFRLEDRLFAAMRVVIVIAATVFYFVDITLGPTWIPGAGVKLMLFWVWSIVVVWIIYADARRHTDRTESLKRILIGVTLPVDLFFIYSAASATDGLESSFFVATFVLLVFHAYYFPTYFPRLQSPGLRWTFSGATAGAVGFIVIYFMLDPEPPLQDVNFWISSFFALILGLTACVLRNQDIVTNTRLRRAIEMAQLFRGVIKRVNEIYQSSSEMRSKDSSFDELAETIGRNLSGTSCEIFLLHEGQTYERIGKWLSVEATEEYRGWIVNNATVVYRLKPKVHIEKSKRVARYSCHDDDHAIESSSLTKAMSGFLAHNSIDDCICTLILGKPQDDKMRPVGMIRISNHHRPEAKSVAGGFSAEDEDIVEEVAKEISAAIENYLLQSRLNKTLEKETRLRQIALKDNLDEIILEILASMSEMVDGGYAELWTPFEDGFERRQKLVLRAHYPLRGHVAEKLAKTERFISVDESYASKIISQQPLKERIIYREDIREVKDYAWARFINDFGSYQLIAISLARNDELFGVAYLHPGRRFKWDPIIRDKLWEFAELATVSIEGARYNRRYRQIRKIQHGIAKLLVEDDNLFYQNIAELVNEIVPAEACSVFLVDQEKQNLILRGSSDKSEDTQQRIGTAPYRFGDGSLTARVAETGESVTKFAKPIQTIGFIEKTSTTASSLMICPARDSKNTVIAAIRCVNKRFEPNIVTRTFSKRDMDMFEFVVGIIAALLENRMNIISLEALNRQRQSFMSTVAHEFISPLQAIRSSTEFLKRFYDKPGRLKDPKAKFDYLIEEVDFLHYLIANIRTLFDESSDGPFPFETTKIDLFKIVEKIQTLLKGEARERGLEIKLAGYFPSMVVDKFHLEQVIFNLLVNAIKYTKPNTGRPIEIICEDHSNQVLLIVRNWGIGIAKEEVESVFQMYKRGAQAHAQAVSGTGLGLYISRNIMRRLNGDLQLSKLHEPTEFTVYLPRV